MGVPAGDERDQRLADSEGIAWSREDIGNPNGNISEKILEKLRTEGKLQSDVNCHSLRDWLVSRQRYWGTPIPIIHCRKCGVQPVPESELPVKLLPLLDSDSPASHQLEKKPIKVKGTEPSCTCPKCGSSDAVREHDTLDTFVDSSWYFLRFLDSNNKTCLVSKEKASWMPVKAYIGGMEHAIKHLLYARFVNKFLFDLGVVPCSEPFENIITQGLVKAESYRLKSTGQYITRDTAKKLPPDEVVREVEKMSKSKLNGISPIEAIQTYGVDCLKLALFSAGPVEKDIEISENLLSSMVQVSNSRDHCWTGSRNSSLTSRRVALFSHRH